MALCTFNGLPWLPAQVESLINQTVVPDEIVICDDGSTDGTISYLESLGSASSEQFVVCINPKRLGFCRNFEAAIARCTGDVIFLCDQDDVWHPDKISMYLDMFSRQSQVVLVMSNSELVGEDLVSLGKNVWTEYHFSKDWMRRIGSADWPLKLVIRNHSFLGHTMAFRSAIRPLISPVLLSGHDFWIALVAASVGRIGVIDEFLTQYRIHSRQQCQGAVGERYLGNFAKVTPGTHFEHKASVYDELADRLDCERRSGSSVGALIQAKTIALLREKAQYARRRGALRKDRFSRLLTATALLLDGSYFRYGRGILSFGKDLLR